MLNLLKNDPSLPAEENLNRSVEMLEFEFMNAIRTLLRESPVQIAFLDGHNEADSLHVLDFSSVLAGGYKVSRIKCDHLLSGKGQH